MRYGKGITGFYVGVGLLALTGCAIGRNGVLEKCTTIFVYPQDNFMITKIDFGCDGTFEKTIETKFNKKGRPERTIFYDDARRIKRVFDYPPEQNSIDSLKRGF